MQFRERTNSLWAAETLSWDGLITMPFGGVGSLLQADCVEHPGGEPLGGAKQGQTSPSRAKERLKNHFGS